MFEFLALPALSVHGEQHRESMRVVGIMRGGVGNCRIGSCCCLLLAIFIIIRISIITITLNITIIIWKLLLLVSTVNFSRPDFTCNTWITYYYVWHLRDLTYDTTNTFNTCHNWKREVRRLLH